MADSWEPGAPSLRDVAPGVIGGAVIPLAVYYSVRHHVHGDATALMIAGAPAAAWVTVEWARKHRLDPIGCITLFGFVAGVTASLLLGGSAFVLKVRDSAFTCLFGVVCLASLTRSRPLMFFVGRALSAGDNPEKVQAYEQLWTMPTAPRTFRIITAIWGAGLLVEGSARVALAAVLPTGTFLAVSPILAAVMIGGMFAFTVWFSQRARQRGEAELAATGLVYPTVGGPVGEPAERTGSA